MKHLGLGNRGTLGVGRVVDSWTRCSAYAARVVGRLGERQDLLGSGTEGCFLVRVHDGCEGCEVVMSEWIVKAAVACCG